MHLNVWCRQLVITVFRKHLLYFNKSHLRIIEGISITCKGKRHSIVSMLPHYVLLQPNNWQKQIANENINTVGTFSKSTKKYCLLWWWPNTPFDIKNEKEIFHFSPKWKVSPSSLTLHCVWSILQKPIKSLTFHI